MPLCFHREIRAIVVKIYYLMSDHKSLRNSNGSSLHSWGEGDCNDTSAVSFNEAFFDLVNRLNAQGLHNPVS
jgi:hypothetical protein